MEISLEEYNDLIDRANRQLDEKRHRRREVCIFARILAVIDTECRGDDAKSYTEYIRLVDERADENNSPCQSAADAVNSLCPDLFAAIRKLKEHQQRQWNSLPCALRWTHEPPKVAGWYWHKNCLGVTLMDLRTMDEGKAKIKAIDGWLWAGPIHQPIEA